MPSIRQHKTCFWRVYAWDRTCFNVTSVRYVRVPKTGAKVNLKGSTARTAESHLRAHILPKLGDVPLTEINAKTVQAFVAHLAVVDVQERR